MTTRTVATCSVCRRQITLELPDAHGVAGVWLRALAPALTICDTCAAELARRERDRERARSLVVRRARSAIPPALANVTFNRYRWPSHAQRAAEEWARGNEPLLVISGPVGTGKTWLAAAAANLALELGHSPVWVEGLRVAAPMTLGPEGRNQLAERLARPGPLIIDDIDKTGGSEWGAGQVLAAIDTAITHHRPLLATTNLDLVETAVRLGEPVASRLATARWVRLTGPDRRTAQTQEGAP